MCNAMTDGHEVAVRDKQMRLRHIGRSQREAPSQPEGAQIEADGAH
jgi:hypothetical protein